MFIYRFGGKQREAGLGKAGKNAVTLANAREQARKGRELLDQRPSVDPLTVWRPTHATSVRTFAEAAAAYIALHEPGWRSSTHARQWRETINAYCKPLLNVPVDQIDAQMVRRALEPVWLRIPETGSRLRGRIEMIIDFAKSDDDLKPNPARWRGGLRGKLPAPKRLGNRRHSTALPYADVPEFVRRLRAETSVVARAIEFVLLTATRSGEARGAQWSEIDEHAATWTIPWRRLKTGDRTREPFLVPLSGRTLELLGEMRAVASSAFIFPGRYAMSQPLSAAAFLQFVKREMGMTVTLHGFRSSFRDWAGDETNFSRETCEAALGHVVGGVEGAYRRSDALAKRRLLMDAWAAYCDSPPPGDENAADNVLSFETRSARAKA